MTAPTSLSNGPTLIETQCDLVFEAIEQIEKQGIRSIEAEIVAEDEWNNIIEGMNKNTLFPLTNSWWNGGNIPGKKAQNITHTEGIAVYEAQSRQRLNNWEGFTVIPLAKGEKGKKTSVIVKSDIIPSGMMPERTEGVVGA